METTIRERRRRKAAKIGRKRLLVAVVLTAIFHVVAIPAVLLSFHYTPGPEPEVSLVRIPAKQWDAAMGGARQAQSNDAQGERRLRDPQESQPPEEKVEEAKPEKAPGQVVETAPGNREIPDGPSFAAESDNKVDRESVSRDRRAGAKVTTPKATAPAIEEAPPGEPSPEGALVIGSGGDDKAPGEAESFGSKLEIPSVAQRDELQLEVSPDGVGSTHNRSGSEALEGNSDRFRIQAGDGEGEADRPGGGGPAGGRTLQLFPSAAVVDSIIGAPAPDHVEGVEEGDGTFLNTREWRFASFMNRLKQGVSRTWDPNGVARTRDPTGNVYLWKDRHTVLSVTLQSDGRIADVFVEKSSGVDFLDQEAIAAFQRAQPFPNPPRGMMDEQGKIHFQFGFFIDTGHVGMRIFRR